MFHNRSLKVHCTLIKEEKKELWTQLPLYLKERFVYSPLKATLNCQSLTIHKYTQVSVLVLQPVYPLFTVLILFL